ncbi:hypothetical protein SCP_0509640 [Sparassis crispa]|uniref:F-box domain-containing protein n=1 Tax=Sparassis crispa TaxID=139825 RepID=A0A401GNV5_9APHY|nr:hypothetical protein SCP_0509640 [Sparassis crispa]GBE83905.1 hypothetical protein SCP_0509640 [Sparassis crispa]
MPLKKAKKSEATPSNAAREVAAAPQSARRALRGRRGGLKDMPNMPLDIVLEIISHLNPRDLLNLARTSKAFRALLMTRTSAHLWKAARKNVDGLPDCPPYLSEPEYANLAFSPHCHSCLKSNIQNVIWEFNVRYCNDCKKENTVESPYGLPTGLMSKITSSVNVLNHISGRRYLYLFHVPQIDAFVKSWRAVASDEGEKKLIKEQAERVNQIKEYSRLCNEWTKLRVKSRASELDDVRRARLESIVSRLRDLGWGEELDFLEPKQYSPLSNHAHARQAKPLTDRGWQKICDEMVSYMEKLKTQRLAEEHRERLHSRLALLSDLIDNYYAGIPRTPASEYLPHLVDFAMMSEFRALVDALDSVNITPDDFLALRPQIPNLVEKWQNNAKAELTLLLAEELGLTDIPDDTNIFDLAVAWFQCTKCRKVLRYPNIIAHGCMRQYYHGFYHPDAAHEYQALVYGEARTAAWSTASISCSRPVQRAYMLVKACGKDPSSTTARAMDELDARFWWKNPSALPSRSVVSWRLAMKPKWTRKHVGGVSERQWEVVNGNVAEKVKVVEAKSQITRRFKHELRRHWCCSLCTEIGGRKCSLPQVKEHVRNLHSIDDPTVENGRIYLHPDSKPLLPKSIMALKSTGNSEYELSREAMNLLREGRACLCDYD